VSLSYAGVFPTSILVQADDKLLVLGTSTHAIGDNTEYLEVARFTPSGSSDASFGLNGEISSTRGAFNDAAFTSDGNLVVVGFSFTPTGDRPTVRKYLLH
jgi:hypothetical protein